MKKKLKNIILDLIMAVLLILLAAVMISRLFFGVRFNAVLTGSMAPVLPVGCLIVTSPAEYEDIRIGDDITYIRDERLTLVTHRVISKDDSLRRLTTQGLGNNIPDAPVNIENVVGKVRFSIPYAGYAVIYLGTAKGKIVFAAAAAALLALSLLIPEKEPKDDTADEKE